MIRNPALDGLRGLAILLVMLFHSGLLDLGWMGVNLFFLLSGYLITQVLLPWKEAGLSFYLKRFWWRRSLRIFPLFYAFLGLIVLGFAFTGMPANTLEELPYLLTYSINFRGLFTLHRNSEFFNFIWSLCVEEQFYLIWPLVVFFTRKKQLLRVAMIVLLLSPLLRFGLGEYWAEAHGTRLGIGGAVYILPFTQLDGFMMGAILALIGKDIPRKIAIRWGIASLLTIASLGTVCLLSFWNDGRMLHWSSFGFPIASWAYQMHVWVYSLLALVFGGLMVQLLHQPTGRLHRYCSWQPLRFTGKVSYGLYLIHMPVITLMVKIVPLPTTYGGRILYFIPFFALSIGLAWISYRYFESRFLGMKNRRFNEMPTASE